MAATPGQRWPRFRWFVVAMLAAAAVLNYVDRQTLALMAGTIQGQLRISDVGYATLVNAFLAAYTIGGLISALIVDRVIHFAGGPDNLPDDLTVVCIKRVSPA